MPTMSNTTIQDVANRLLQHKYAHVSAETMRALTGVRDCPDDDDDDAAHRGLASLWDETAPQRDETGREVYPGKRSLCSYYDYNDDGVHATAHGTSPSSSPSSSSNDDDDDHPSVTIEHIDPTTMHQVSNYRVHRAWPSRAHTHPTLVAMRKAVFQVLACLLPRLEELSTTGTTGGADNNNTPRTIEGFQAMQTAYRVIQVPDGPVRGNPGPEGVHQDDATLTVIILMRKRNVRGGDNRVWTLDQPNGKPSAVDARERLLYRRVLEEPLESLWVLDRHVKHEATDIHPVDTHAKALRDVLTFEVRPNPDFRGGRERNASS